MQLTKQNDVIQHYHIITGDNDEIHVKDKEFPRYKANVDNKHGIKTIHGPFIRYPMSS